MAPPKTKYDPATGLVYTRDAKTGLYTNRDMKIRHPTKKDEYVTNSRTIIDEDAIGKTPPGWSRPITEDDVARSKSAREISKRLGYIADAGPVRPGGAPSRRATQAPASSGAATGRADTPPPPVAERQPRGMLSYTAAGRQADEAPPGLPGYVDAYQPPPAPAPMDFTSSLDMAPLALPQFEFSQFDPGQTPRPPEMPEFRSSLDIYGDDYSPSKYSFADIDYTDPDALSRRTGDGMPKYRHGGPVGSMPRGLTPRSYRGGGHIPMDADNRLEPRVIEAHEGEYVIRPEAVQAIGVPALDRLNEMNGATAPMSGPKPMSGQKPMTYDDKGCFISTAVTQMNGEADDGMTLTKLRDFRDSFMQETPARRQLVEHYYSIGPKITEAIPKGSRTWPLVNAAVGKIVGRIDEGNYEGAMEGYAKMMDRLTDYYLKGTGTSGPAATYEGDGGGTDGMQPHRRAGRTEMFSNRTNEGGSTGIPALDQLRTLSGPRPNGLAYRYDRKRGRVEQMGRM